MTGGYLLYRLNSTAGKGSLFSQPISNGQPTTTTNRPKPVVYGYLPYWTINDAQFPNSLTHVSYFSLTIQPDGRILDVPRANQDNGHRLLYLGYLDELHAKLLPTQQLEVTLTMLDQEHIPEFIHDEQARERLIADVGKLMDTYPLIGGINIDIEYSGEVEQELRDDYVALMKSLRDTTQRKRPGFLLTMAVYGNSGQFQRLTDLAGSAPYVDYVIMMAYDYHRRASPRSGPVSPLYGKLTGKWDGDIVNDLRAIREQVPSEKILLGVPFYGYEWSVEDAANPQSFTLPRTGATATYKRIKELLKEPGVQLFWDETGYSPYIQYERNGKTQRIYFDDAQSLSYKVDLVKQAGLGGIAIWALGYEGEHMELWKELEKL